MVVGVRLKMKENQPQTMQNFNNSSSQWTEEKTKTRIKNHTDLEDELKKRKEKKRIIIILDSQIEFSLRHSGAKEENL